MKPWKMRSLKLAMLAALGCLVPALAHAELKLGIDALQLNDAQYSHQGVGFEDDNRSLMVGSQIFLEYLPSEQFGLEVDYALSPLQRSYQLGGGLISSNVAEQASYFTVGANMYLFYKKREGLHPVVGVATGVLTVTQKFQGGSLGSTTTTNSVNIDMVKLGLEWIINNAGVRLQVQQWAGESTNTTKLAGVRQINDYSGTVALLGVFAFFH